MLQPGRVAAALWSPHERRVESRDAIPRLAAWLEQAHGVTFLRRRRRARRSPGRGRDTTGPVRAEAAVVCPGDDLVTLFPERIAAFD